MPHTDQFSLGYERELGSNFSVSADYVRAMSRDLLMSQELNPQIRNSPTVAGSTLTRAGSDAADARRPTALQATYPGSRRSRPTSTIPVNVASTDYDALLFLSSGASGTTTALASRTPIRRRVAIRSGNGVPTSGFQVFDDLNLDLNEGPTNTDLPHNFVVSGMAIVPKTGGLSVSWVARALSGTPFSLFNNTIDPDLNGMLVRTTGGRHLFGDRRRPLHGR